MLTVSYPMCHPTFSLEGTKSLSNVLIHKQNSFLTKLWEFPADFLEDFFV